MSNGFKALMEAILSW